MTATTTPAVDNRQKILQAAASLFGRQGFHGTSTRDIAKAAGVSLGNIYNHFSTKEELFVHLLERYRVEYFRPDQPLAMAMTSSTFPENVEEIGIASRETVRRFAPYMRLIYVDVVEFDAAHVGPVFRAMRDRYTDIILGQGVDKRRFRVDPVAALMMTTWGFFTYFITEKLFGVQRHYGMADDEVIRLFAEVIRNGALRGGKA